MDQSIVIEHLVSVTRITLITCEVDHKIKRSVQSQISDVHILMRNSRLEKLTPPDNTFQQLTKLSFFFHRTQSAEGTLGH